MLVIGEHINGMFRAVNQAIQDRDESVIRKLAKDQISSGAGMLDVCTGPYSKNPSDDMKWLIETIQKEVSAPLCLDSTKPDVIEAGLGLVKERALINSTNADPDKMDRIFTIAKRYNARIIGLTMDKSGVPNNKDKRLEFAAILLAKAAEYDIPSDDIFLDPIAMPVNVAQSQGVELFEALREFRLLSDPAPHTTIGLSNVSQGAKPRSLINRTFLVMALANGLSSAIMDALDKDLMDAAITAELVLNKSIYCDSFLDAYRKK